MKPLILAVVLTLAAWPAAAQSGSNYDANGAWDPPGSNYAPTMPQDDSAWNNRFNAPTSPYPQGSQQTPWTQLYNTTHGYNPDGSQ
jgi:hypothetical protein